MSGILQSFAYGRAFTTPPVNVTAPVVSGTATVGQTLSCTTGTWTGLPTPTYTYQWQRVTTPISGATSSTYVLVAADAGSTIRCLVTATNSAGSAATASNSTASVAATVPGAPTIGTATATGSSTATVTYTAPASNGGATITSYTAVSSPGSITGTLSTSGSGTITVTGLSESTSYTFVVYATNSAGNSANSGSSNSITTPASYWITYTGQRSITYNPYTSRYTGGTEVYGWDVSSDGYTYLPVFTSPNRATYFGILNPSGTRYGGYYQSTVGVDGYYTNPYSVLNPHINLSGNVVVMNGNYNFSMWNRTGGSPLYNYAGVGINVFDVVGNFLIDSSSSLWQGKVLYDGKSGVTNFGYYQIAPNGSYYTRDVYFAGYFGDTFADVKIAIRSDGSLFFNYGAYGFLFNSSVNSVLLQKSCTTAGFGLGNRPSICLFDSSNNLYLMGNYSTGSPQSIAKVNSSFSSGNKHNYSSGIAGGGAAIYGNYLYTMYANGADYFHLSAINISTMAVVWSKKLTFTIPGQTVSNVWTGANGNSVRANATGVYFYFIVPSQETGAIQTFVMKASLTTGLTNTSYSLGGSVSVAITDTGIFLESTTATTYNNLSYSYSYGSSTQGSVPSYTWSANGSVLPTASKTTIT